MGRKVTTTSFKDYREDQCAVCLAESCVSELDTRLFPCGHTFHGECLIQWVNVQQEQNQKHGSPKFECPLCRQQIAHFIQMTGDQVINDQLIRIWNQHQYQCSDIDASDGIEESIKSIQENRDKDSVQKIKVKDESKELIEMSPSPGTKVKEECSITISHHGDSVEEYDSAMDLYNGLGDDWDPNTKLEPLIPLQLTLSNDHDTESTQHGLSRDGLERFFVSFIDSELEGEVNVCSWITSLSELCPKLTEKELYSLFVHIDREQSGFVDVVDFVQFCDGESHETDVDGQIETYRSNLLDAIESHPFFSKLDSVSMSH